MEDSLYYVGYNDAITCQAEKYPFDSEYMSGYQDALGDLELGVGYEKTRPVDDDYYLFHSAPPGFNWAGYKATPNPGEWYLTKNGNAKLAEKVRGNSQRRHILQVM